PSPSAVLFSFSRSSSACTRRLRSISGCPAATTAASSRMTSPLPWPRSSTTTISGVRMSVIFRTSPLAALGLDQAVVAVGAAVENRDALVRGVGEDEELVARGGELRDRFLDRHRLRRKALRADHLGRPTRPAAVGGEHGAGELGDVDGAGIGSTLVMPEPPVQLLRLVLELVDREVDRRIEVVRRLLGEHRLVVRLERDLRDV